MANLCFIRALGFAAMVAATGCATRIPLEPTPLGQDELDQFLASGRDARTYGITTYQDAAGPRFEFANRVHPHRSAQMDFISPRNLPLPMIKARTGRYVDCHLLLDTSARQSWLLLPSVEAMDYRPFAPPIGEYPDHVLSDLPGYAGVANKVVLDTLHIESPIFYVPPARGGLGALARADELPRTEPDAKVRRAQGQRTHAVLGATVLRSFSFVRFDFPERTVRVSTDATYRPAESGAVLASLPLRDWRGRPAVDATLGGEPVLLVIDTAGEFDLSLPDAASANGPLALGDLAIDGLHLSSHESHDLPAAYPARLGLGILARYALTLDYKQRRVWIEGRPLRDANKTSTSMDDETTAPVHYRGIK